MINDFSFSLEDLSDGIFASRKRDITTELPDYIKSRECVDILLNPSDEPVAFAMEAFEELKNAELFGAYADNTLNVMKHEIKLLSTIKNKYSVERLDPLAFSTEEKKSLFKTVWNAIVTAFKRLILAVTNFIRSALNWFGSLAFKNQSSYYEANKDRLSTLLKDKGTNQFKGTKPIINFGEKGTISKLIGSIDDMDKNLGKIDKAFNEFKALGDAIASGKAGTAFKLSVKKILPKKTIQDIIDSSVKSLACGNSKVVQGFGTKELGAPRRVASIVVYDDPKGVKPVNLSINEFFKYTSHTILTKENSDAMKKYVESGKKIAKSMGKALVDIEKFKNKLDGFKKENVDNSSYSEYIHKMADMATASRLFRGYVTGIFLNIFSFYIRQRSIAFKAVRMVCGKKEKKAKEEKKK